MAEDREIPQNLQCPMCMDMFTRATLLTCGHTFCQRCLSDYDASQSNRRGINCPLCRKPTPLTRDRVAGLAPNVTVNSLIDDFLNIQVANEESSLTVLKEIEMSDGMRGMARLSDDTVVIGYGRSKPGVEAYAVTGTKRSFLPEAVGLVRDIAILTDGNVVVSHGKNVIKVYSSTGHPTGIEFFTHESCENYMLCSDNHDNVYAANLTDAIYVFKAGRNIPQHVIPTGNLNADQVCVTSNGTIIARSYSTNIIHRNAITIYNRDGQMGSSVKACEEQEYLHAAVDSQDRVFVGHVLFKSSSFRLSIYKVEGLQLIEEVTFKDLSLPKASRAWHYMVSLTPSLLALANRDKKLYFIKVPGVSPGTQ